MHTALIAVSHSISIRNGKEGDSCVHLLWGLKAVMGNGKKCRTANCAEFQNMFALSSLLKTSKSVCCELQLIPTPLNRPMFYHFVLRGSVRFNFAEVGLKKWFLTSIYHWKGQGEREDIVLDFRLLGILAWSKSGSGTEDYGAHNVGQERASGRCNVIFGWVTRPPTSPQRSPK